MSFSFSAGIDRNEQLPSNSSWNSLTSRVLDYLLLFYFRIAQMADPISLAASIITLVHVTDSVLTSCYTYIGRVKAAAAEIEKAVLETSTLKGILLNLHELSLNEPDNASLQVLSGPLAACLATLKDMETRLRPLSEKLTTKRKLIWPFEARKLDELLGRIREQKPQLMLTLAVDAADLSRQIRTGVEDIKLSLEYTQLREDRENILRWLHPNDPKAKHMKCREDHRAGTNKWVLDHHLFNKWFTQPQGLLWARCFSST
jgi:hypothetical protein